MINKTFKEDLFNGKVAVVVGGTSGNGHAIAISLAELSAKVYALGLDSDKAIYPEGLNIIPTEMNVLKVEDLRAFFTTLESLDYLYNGAGAQLKGEMTDEGFRKSLDLNLYPTLTVCNLARPLLAKSKDAAIVNVSSMSAIFGSAGFPGNAASKAAVAELTRCLALAYAEDGIRVNAICPGWIETRLLDPIKADEVFYNSIMDRMPMKRFGQPSEVGQLVAYLMSPAASYLTGTIVPIDGGYSIV